MSNASPFQSDIKPFVQFIAGDDGMVALVMLNGTLNGRFAGRNAIGFYKDREAFFAKAEALNGNGNLYINLNELNPAVYSRAADRFKAHADKRFSDSEIVRRRTLLVDFDARRISGVNSTDQELHYAIELASKVRSDLTQMWDVEPLMLMSGNGAQLLYPIDEPADSPLVAEVLKSLNSRYSNENVQVDTSVSDAARITRLAGTLNMKGDDVADRPQRVAKVLNVPSERKVVTTEQLSKLMVTSDAVQLEPKQVTQGPWTEGKVRELLDHDYKSFNGHGWDYREEPHDEFGTMFKIQQCPFVTHHIEYRAALWLNNGVLCYKCFSDECDGANKRTGADFVRLIKKEPPLALTDELRLARHVLSTMTHSGVPALRHYQGAWYQWDKHWQKFDSDEFDVHVYRVCKEYVVDHFSDEGHKHSKSPHTVPKVTRAAIANVLLALKSLVEISSAGWIDGRGGKWIAFEDQILSLNAWIDGKTECVPQTPEYFSPTVINYPLSFTEEEPSILLAKLNEQVSESEVSTLQEFGGYCMTDDTSIQRILYMIGPARSFKGTFEKVIRATIGDHNAASKNFASFLGAHALENVPDKTLLAISDSRPDPRISRQAVERLLSISGEDPQDINPKQKRPYTVKLVCKIGIASNIMADFADPTGALSSRFLFVETTKSFALNPDRKLLAKILEQQNQITWWFLRGLRRLLQNGRYTEPQNKLASRFQLLSNPIPHFVNEKCKVTGELKDKLNRDELFDTFDLWAGNQQVPGLEKSVFFRDLYSAFPQVKGHERYVSGIAFLAV